MPIGYPDIINHNNSDFALMESSELRGGAVNLVDKAARNAIPSDKRAKYMIVSYHNGTSIVTERYDGIGLDNTAWIDDANWTQVGSGSSGGGKFGAVYKFDEEVLNNPVQDGFIKVMTDETVRSATYGYMYNWYALSKEFFAPTDWKIPSVADFNILISELGGIAVAGGKLKSRVADSWTTPNLLEEPDSGFNLFGNTPRRGSDGGFALTTIAAKTTTRVAAIDSNSTNASYMYVTYNELDAEAFLYGVTKEEGFSVRLIYDGVGEPPSTITDYDGNIYNVVKIGNQYWTQQNWISTHYEDGREIPEIIEDCIWANLSLREELFGELYNWAAVIEPEFGITDWEIPTQSDFNTLISNSGGSSVAGGNLKRDNCAIWNTPNIMGTENGFDAVAAGYGNGDTPVGFRGETGYYWCFPTLGGSSGLGTAMYIYRYNTEAEILKPGPAYAFSVRLIYKGTGTPGATVTDYNGNVYNVIQIGSQYWLKENFKCRNLKDGTPLPIITDQDISTVGPAIDGSTSQLNGIGRCIQETNSEVSISVKFLDISKKMLGIGYENFINKITNGDEVLFYQTNDESKFKKVSITGDIIDNGTYYSFPYSILEESTSNIDDDAEVSLITNSVGGGGSSLWETDGTDIWTLSRKVFIGTSTNVSGAKTVTEIENGSQLQHGSMRESTRNELFLAGDSSGTVNELMFGIKGSTGDLLKSWSISDRNQTQKKLIIYAGSGVTDHGGWLPLMTFKGDNGGAIGINNQSPQTALHMDSPYGINDTYFTMGSANSSGILSRTNGGSTAYKDFGIFCRDFTVSTATADGGSSSSEAFRVSNTTGRVGVGTNFSSGEITNKFTVISQDDAISGLSQMKIHSYNSVIGYGSGISFGVSGDHNYIGAKIIHVREGSNSAGSLKFYVRSNTATGYDLVSHGMTLTSSGNLRVGDGTRDANVSASYSDGSVTEVHGYGITMNRGTNYLRPAANNVSNLYIGGSAVGANDWARVDLRVTSSFNVLGNLAVGVTSASHRLHVSGRMYSTQGRVPTATLHGSVTNASIFNALHADLGTGYGDKMIVTGMVNEFTLVVAYAWRFDNNNIRLYGYNINSATTGFMSIVRNDTSSKRVALAW